MTAEPCPHHPDGCPGGQSRAGGRPVSPVARRVLGAEEVFAHALRGEPCHLAIGGTDQRVALPVVDWTRDTDDSDELLLGWCVGPTIDIGCGPGRMVTELAARGHLSLGIDVVPEAVRQTRLRGGAAMRRDVFERVPGEGRWQTALLADGNVGIGGDPVALLARVRRMLRPGGRIVVETAAPGSASRSFDARLECACAASDAFGWAIVSIEDLPDMAADAGLREERRRTAEGRWAAVLTEAA